MSTDEVLQFETIKIHLCDAPSIHTWPRHK